MIGRDQIASYREILARNPKLSSPPLGQGMEFVFNSLTNQNQAPVASETKGTGGNGSVVRG